MKNEQELNHDILEVSMIIGESYPELSKYLGEMPIRIADGIKVKTDLNDLEDYYGSLETLLNKYRVTHIKTKSISHQPITF